MIPVLEAVPNFSEGRDLDAVRALVDHIARAGPDVLDWSADPDHNRSVVTFVGDPPTVEAGALAAARFALEHIDLREHEGVHPRIGALDVCPFVPLRGLTMDEAAAAAHRVGRAVADLGIPVYYYGQASRPPGRGLAELRRGGFEGLRDGFPEGRTPDELPEGVSAAHPSAGATAVGARDVLLAWNVFVEGLELSQVRAIAADIRESGGGFAGLRALGLALRSSGRLQISMNLEDPVGTSPMDVFRAIEGAVGERAGSVAGTEVIGMIPDALVLPAAADRLDLLDCGSARILSHRVADHTVRRLEEGANRASRAMEAGGAEPRQDRQAAPPQRGGSRDSSTPDGES